MDFLMFKFPAGFIQRGFCRLVCEWKLFPEWIVWPVL